MEPQGSFAEKLMRQGINYATPDLMGTAFGGGRIMPSPIPDARTLGGIMQSVGQGFMPGINFSDSTGSVNINPAFGSADLRFNNGMSFGVQGMGSQDPMNMTYMVGFGGGSAQGLPPQADGSYDAFLAGQSFGAPIGPQGTGLAPRRQLSDSPERRTAAQQLLDETVKGYMERNPGALRY